MVPLLSHGAAGFQGVAWLVSLLREYGPLHPQKQQQRMENAFLVETFCYFQVSWVVGKLHPAHFQ